MSIEVSKVKTDNFEMNYCKFGKGERTAVILPGLSVKSVMGSADSIASRYRAMQDDYTVYVFDRRTVCPEGYSIKDMSDDTARAFIELGLKNIYLFGVSQGGMIAQYITLDYPELICKLALCSTIARATDDNSGVIKEWIKLAEQRNEDELYKRIVNAVYSNEFAKKIEKFCIELMRGTTEDELNRFINLAKSCDGFDVYNRLGEIKCPAFVIGSKADKVFDFTYIAELAERLAARFKVYEGYGHATYDEAPDCVDEIVNFYNLKF